ncbi:MAG: hypothetical protein ABI036_10675 [Fibrobacteria bacterium]
MPVSVPDPAGPTLPAFCSAFSGSPLIRADAQGFQAFVASHPGQGRLLTGSELQSAVTVAAASRTSGPGSRPATGADVRKDSSIAADSTSGTVGNGKAQVDSLADTASVHAPRALREIAAKRAAHQDSLRRDSLAVYGIAHPAAQATSPDSLILGLPIEGETTAEHTMVADKDVTRGWFVNLMADWNGWGHGKGGGGGGGGDPDWAAIIFVVVGVVVVGAFLIYGAQAVYELATNDEDVPVFQEMGLRLSYSGQKFGGADGEPDLYRDTYLTGIRYAIGLDRPGMGMGLSVEGGYLDVKLRGVSDPSRSFDFRGGYLVAGPLLRFGHNDPFSFSLEFLNGTSTHASIGWISKSRMTFQAKVASHTLVGAHLGAAFYDLHFLDGLAWRQGDFNRDLTMIYGLEAGWEF